MTDYKGLIERVRALADAVCFDEPKLAPHADWSQDPQILVVGAIRDLASALEATLARLEAAEKVCEAVENMRDVSLDLKTALGLEHKVHEALDAWREAKSS